MENIYLHLKNAEILIYIKSKKASPNQYIRYNLHHFIKAFSDGGIAQNYDLWRLYELYNFILKDDMYFERGMNFELVNSGEWECAIKVLNTPDFHGGYHGYEKQTEIDAYIDGVQLDDFSANILQVANEFIFIQKSEIFKQGTENEIIAYHTKHYTFSENGLQLHQEVEWVQSLVIECAYLTMMPIKRTSDDTARGVQITEKATTNDDYMPHDVSREAHHTVISPGNTLQNITYAKIWGEASGVVSEVSISGGKNGSFFVQNTKQYNKLYFSYFDLKNKYTVQVGEKWVADSFYDIYISLPN